MSSDKKKYSNWVWVEAYRPESVKDTILPKEYKKAFLKMVEAKNIPNLLFYSNAAGVGKCTFWDTELEIEVSEKVYNNNKHLFED